VSTSTQLIGRPPQNGTKHLLVHCYKIVVLTSRWSWKGGISRCKVQASKVLRTSVTSQMNNALQVFTSYWCSQAPEVGVRSKFNSYLLQCTMKYFWTLNTWSATIWRICVEVIHARWRRRNPSLKENYSLDLLCTTN
jgi:hypothetical protein